MADAVSPAPRWQLAAEAIVVKIRWFGLLFGFLYVNVHPEPGYPALLNGILLVGFVFTVADSFYSSQGRVLFGQLPLLVSIMEALFISLLCHFDRGLESPFQSYYLLSLVCTAIRYSPGVTYLTFAIDAASYLALAAAQPAAARDPMSVLLMVGVLGWVTWASSALSSIIKGGGEELERLNAALRENQAQLEERIAERTRALQQAQALVLHQEKMAAFGLLAAGIAHEVGNPLTSVSAIVQLLQSRDTDDYTRERLGLVSGQLQRIRNTLRELVNFSRPHNSERGRVPPHEIIDEALGIAKYYKGGKSRVVTAEVAPGLPAVHAVRDHLVQVILNLVLNAMDATSKGGRIEVRAQAVGRGVEVSVHDNGSGLPPEHAAKLFQPYFTTKKYGTGLGLFVSRQLVLAHGGRVEFESTPGVGTVFRVTLPALVESAEPAA